MIMRKHLRKIRKSGRQLLAESRVINDNQPLPDGDDSGRVEKVLIGLVLGAGLISGGMALARLLH